MEVYMLWLIGLNPRWYYYRKQIGYFDNIWDCMEYLYILKKGLDDLERRIQ
jgi:hypothetical protein